jgi:uroporphyrin-III C-methyltransferase
MAPRPDSGFVYFVGAGPGDPELLTLRAFRLLRTADAILHDDLVSKEILACANPDATIENVGKRCGFRGISQEDINERMIEFAQCGLKVARLKGGDPSIFGRLAEEIAALAQAEISFEIVPGITAASAAAAAAKIPLTSRKSSSQLIFLTGHRAGGAPIEIPLPTTRDSTIAVYMPALEYKELAERFLAAGWPINTPCLVVSTASQSSQQILAGNLGDLRFRQRLPSPAVLILGNVVTGTRFAATNPAAACSFQGQS